MASPYTSNTGKRVAEAFLPWQVAPGVCVSGEKVARDRDLLRRSGVTHVVNCVGMLVPECFPNDFRYLTLYLRGEMEFYIRMWDGGRSCHHSPC